MVGSRLRHLPFVCLFVFPNSKIWFSSLTPTRLEDTQINTMRIIQLFPFSTLRGKSTPMDLVVLSKIKTLRSLAITAQVPPPSSLSLSTVQKKTAFSGRKDPSECVLSNPTFLHGPFASWRKAKKIANCWGSLNLALPSWPRSSTKFFPFFRFFCLFFVCLFYFFSFWF